MSSPHDAIDPLICAYSEPKRAKRGGANSADSPAAEGSSRSNSASAGAIGSNPPRVSTSMTGWTPLVSRTLNNDLVSLNSTPSLKIFSTMMRGPSGPDSEYPGLNLTPFLTHNLNLLANPASAGQISNTGAFTPFYDKSMHMADFFMDLPIMQTPVRAPAGFTPQKNGVTPLKLSLQPDMKSDMRLNALRLLKKLLDDAAREKRTLALLDTPARKAPKKTGRTESDAEDEPRRKKNKSEQANGGTDEAEADRLAIARLDAHFVTPLKRALAPLPPATLNKTPASSRKNNFLTPAAHAVSLPSTVIMLSAQKSPHAKPGPPLSPTPNKSKYAATAEPVMGIFSEKTRPKAEEPVAPPPRKKGINRFQIVFTDVHALLNNKKKKKRSGRAPRLERQESLKQDFPGANHGIASLSITAPPIGHVNPMNGQNHIAGQNSHLGPGHNGQLIHGQPGLGHNGHNGMPTNGHASFLLQDFNTSINTLREFSVLTTSTNNTLGAMDQALFELMRGVRTPDAKFLLDHLFERPSPAAKFPDKALAAMDPQLHDMPPPRAFSLQQVANGARKSDGHNMAMSTPQGGRNVEFAHEPLSPLQKDSMAFLYQHLGLQYMLPYGREQR